MITLCGKPNMLRSEKVQIKKEEKKKELSAEEREMNTYMEGFVNLSLL